MCIKYQPMRREIFCNMGYIFKPPFLATSNEWVKMNLHNNNVKPTDGVENIKWVMLSNKMF